MHLDRRAERLLTEHVAAGPDDELLDSAQLAEWLQCSVQFVEILRGRDDGPDFERIAPKVIRYRRGSIRTWLRQREIRSTAQYMKTKRGKAAAKRAAKAAAR
jgi:hypothetical protein